MPKKKLIILFAIALCVILLPLATNPVLADVGGGLDWDYDGGGGGLDWDFDSGSGGDGMSFGFIYMLFDNPILFIILVVVYLIFFRGKTSSGNKAKRSTGTAPSSIQRPNIKGEDINLTQLTDRDPDFSKQSFLSRVSNVFVTLQNAWTDKDWKSIRTFESDQLFYQHQQQLDDFIEKGQTNVVEDIAVLDTKIEEYSEDTQNSYLNTIIQARYRDYVVDDSNGKVVKGDKNRRYVMTYRMTFMRQLDAKTNPAAETHVTTCPNCGANLSINQHGVCDYCGSEVTTGAQQWVLTRLQPISQQALS